MGEPDRSRWILHASRFAKPDPRRGERRGGTCGKCTEYFVRMLMLISLFSQGWPAAYMYAFVQCMLGHHQVPV